MTATARTSAAQLPRAREIALARAAMRTTRGGKVNEARQDLRWALIDRALEITADPALREYVEQLAHAGDEEALDTMEQIAQLPALLPPKSAGKPRGSYTAAGLVAGGTLGASAGLGASSLPAGRAARSQPPRQPHKRPKRDT